MDDAVLGAAGIELLRPTVGPEGKDGGREAYEFKNDRYAKKHLQDIHKKLSEFSSSTAESESELLRQEAQDALKTFERLSKTLQDKAASGRRSHRRARDDDGPIVASVREVRAYEQGRRDAAEDQDGDGDE